MCGGGGVRLSAWWLNHKSCQKNSQNMPKWKSSPNRWKLKNIWNHHPDDIIFWANYYNTIIIPNLNYKKSFGGIPLLNLNNSFGWPSAVWCLKSWCYFSYFPERNESFDVRSFWVVEETSLCRPNRWPALSAFFPAHAKRKSHQHTKHRGPKIACQAPGQRVVWERWPLNVLGCDHWRT